VITAISHDHTRELGTRLAGIRREKAGILRPGRVAIVAATATRRTDRHPSSRMRAQSAGGAAARSHARADEPRASRHAMAQALARRPIKRANAASANRRRREALSRARASRSRRAPSREACAPCAGRVASRSSPVRPRWCLMERTTTRSADALALTLLPRVPARRVRFVLGPHERQGRARARAAAAAAGKRRRGHDTPGSPRGLSAADLARSVRGVPVRVHQSLGAALSPRAPRQPRTRSCASPIAGATSANEGRARTFPSRRTCSRWTARG
jgi:hypothetical protein